MGETYQGSQLARLGDLLMGLTHREQGPPPSFAPHHMILVILCVGDSGAIGRQALAKETGLGEGAIRTVLSRLRREGYLTVSTSGCSLTSKGESLFDELRRSIPKMTALGRTRLTVGEKQVAIIVRGAAKNITNGIEQRDVAIKAGADGATTFVIRNGKFNVPGGSDDCERDYPEKAWDELRTTLEPVEGDAIIVCGSVSPLLSKAGALSAALSLLSQAR